MQDVVSVNEISGPLELRASLIMYSAANLASLDLDRLPVTELLFVSRPVNAIPSAPTMIASITTAINISGNVNPAS